MHQHDLLDRRAVCYLLGGSKPIHASTLWRLVKQGKIPQPIKISVQYRRWQRSEVEAAIDAMRYPAELQDGRV